MQVARVPEVLVERIKEGKKRSSMVVEPGDSDLTFLLRGDKEKKASLLIVLVAEDTGKGTVANGSQPTLLTKTKTVDFFD
jgi:hypothetical protein